MSTPQTIDLTTRRVPPLGGLNLSLIRIELTRMLRNRRTLFFAIVFPALLFLVFGSQDGSGDTAGSGNVAAYIMVSMALYGASLVAASAGASVAVERALGWSRQLRLTPLNPVVYIGVKALVALIMGGVAIVAVNVAGLIQGKPDMPAGVWVSCALLGVAGSLVFAALGVFVGYLVPGENAMQILGPGLALLAFLGNIFFPIPHSSVFWEISKWTPMFGIGEITRAPMTHELPWYAVVNAVAWLAIFVAGAAWRMGRDTARV